MVVETSMTTVVWSTMISVVPATGGWVVVTAPTVEVVKVSVLTTVLPAGQEITSGPQEVIVLVLVRVTTSVVKDVTGVGVV